MLLKRGANYFINKPFSKEEFSCRLNNAIEALENIDTITHYSKRDFLTGLYNRRHFYTMMEPCFSEEEEFVTVMISIDNYRHHYALHGDDTGDKAVIQIADIIRSRIDYQDILARFEGDEFGLVLKNHTRDSAMELLDQIRQKVAFTPLTLAEEEIALSISIGAVFHPEDTLNDTIDEADSALAQAKAAGGNNLYVQ